MKPVLIFLHGGPGFTDYLEPFFKDLNQDFECVFYDQLSGPQVKMDDLLAQLNALVDSVSTKPILVGHSWGAVLATEYAVKNEKKIAGLVIMSTGLNYKHWSEDYEAELDRLGLQDATYEQIYLAPHELEEGASFMKSTFETFSRETFDSLYESYVKTYDLTKVIASLKIPILNIFGVKDVRFPARVARAFHNFNANMANHEIPEAGHFPFLLSVGRSKIHQILRHAFLV